MFLDINFMFFLDLGIICFFEIYDIFKSLFIVNVFEKFNIKNIINKFIFNNYYDCKRDKYN